MVSQTKHKGLFYGIGLLFRFLYHFFFIDQTTGELSHTNFFSIIGYIIWCWAFPYSVIHGSQASFELWMVFGAVVIGNHTLQAIMLAKNGAAPDDSATWKGKMLNGDGPPSPQIPAVQPPH